MGRPVAARGRGRRPVCRRLWSTRCAAALDGDGPPVLPVPLPDAPAPVRAALLAALRPDDPAAPADVDDAGAGGADVRVDRGAEGCAADRVRRCGRRRRRRRRGCRGRAPGCSRCPLTHVAGLMVLARALLAGGGPDGGGRATRLRAGGVRGGDGDAAAAARAADRPAVRVAGADPAATGCSTPASTCARTTPCCSARPRHRRRCWRGPRTPGARVVTTYGMSETCGGCVYDGVPLDGVSVRRGDADGSDAAGDGVRTGAARRRRRCSPATGCGRT